MPSFPIKIRYGFLGLTNRIYSNSFIKSLAILINVFPNFLKIMNIFENLIDELREENLLEAKVRRNNSESDLAENSPEITNLEEIILDNESAEAESNAGDAHQTPLTSVSLPGAETETVLPETSTQSQLTIVREPETNQQKPDEAAPNNAEFYRKRAVDEVAFLQMVEHVFAGIEREQMKIVPKQFNDLEVKKYLHTFLQVSEKLNTNEQAQAEFQLLQETENWYSVLTHRDKRISVNHLRRYCETKRPPLSSPALVSLARFYRNSPYSEQARGKLDFVITRLFSKDIENEHREMAFSREETVTHLKELYAEWSSIPLYSIDEDDSEILLIALKFEDFITEAAVAGSFDELIRNDFFNRLRLFKKETNENFFAPLVVAAAIESNIRIGNRYVELLENEKSNKSAFEDKYGFLHDQTISDATGKTFQLVELLSQNFEKPKSVEKPVEKSAPVKKQIKAERQTKPETKLPESIKKEARLTTENKKPANTIEKKAKIENQSTQKIEKIEFNNPAGFNKWIWTAAIFTILLSFWLYFWANSNNSTAKEATNVKNVNLENSSLKESIQTARINGETFSASVLPAWNNLPDSRKEEILKKIVSIGGDKGFNKVQLVNNEGKIVGLASPEKVDIYKP